MSEHKILKEMVLFKALTYERDIPDDIWVDEYLVKGTVEVSGEWIRDVITVLTKKLKDKKDAV